MTPSEPHSETLSASLQGEAALVLDAPEPASGLWQRVTGLLGRAAARRGAVTLADQCIVSGTSFLMTVLIGRFSGADVLGTYAIGYTIVILSAVIHESLVSSPYMVLGARHPAGRREEFATATAALHVGLTLVFVGALVLASLLLPAAAGDTWRKLMVALSLVVPCTLLREFARRLAFAHLRADLALACDAAAALIQVSLLAAVAFHGTLSAPRALLILGLASLVAGSGALWAQRQRFARRALETTGDVRASLRFGSPVLAARVVAAVNGNALHWILAIFLSTTATGIFAACMTICLMANPIILGLASTLGPHAARAFADEGPSGLRRVITGGLAVSAGLMLVICGGVALAGDYLMELIYGGGIYSGQTATIAILALHVFFSALGVCLFLGLMTLGRSDVSLKLNLLSLAITLSAAGPLIASYSLAGAALALASGNVITTAIQAVLFFLLVRSTPQ